jgi:ubiquinone/menaquinone biosynthesis C-methylase UbiE
LFEEKVKMKKGKINNNLEIFNDMYREMFNDIDKDERKREYYIGLVNDLLLAPKEMIDFCNEDLQRVPDNSNVLILGGGYGGEANRMKLQYRKYNLYTQDISPWAEKAGKKLVENVNFITGDMCSLDFPDDFFNIVISTHSLEHTSEIDKTMAEVFRVIKDKGLFGLSYPYEWETDEQHVYKFGEDLVEYMSSFGEVEDKVSVEHQSRMMKIIIKKG